MQYLGFRNAHHAFAPLPASMRGTCQSAPADSQNQQLHTILCNVLGEIVICTFPCSLQLVPQGEMQTAGRKFTASLQVNLAELWLWLLLAELYLAWHDSRSCNAQHSAGLMNVCFGGSKEAHQVLGAVGTCGLLSSAGLA